MGRVKVFPLGHGDNTVDVVLVDSTGQPAAEELVKSVQDYIDPDSTGEGYGQAPIGARCYVSAATGKAVAVSCTVSKLNTQDAVSYTHLDVYKRQLGLEHGRPAVRRQGAAGHEAARGERLHRCLLYTSRCV